jgi:enoyl-CoA hydratase
MAATSSETPVRYDVTGAIAVISLARPPVNALTLDMVRAVIAALQRAASDDPVRAVVLASAVAKRFCAGLDIAELAGKSTAEIRTLVHELYVGVAEAQYRLGKPSLAAINGAARGGGMTLAILCDVVIAGDGASFGYPEIDLGVLPAIHFVHLPRIVGRHRAFELLFTGRTFDAKEAAALGLVSRVVPEAQLEQEAHRLARVFAAKPETAMRAGRAAFMRQNDDRRRIAEAVEDFANSAVMDAAQQRLRAFAEKRGLHT